ncbi:hypothetical protein J6590_083126 [Homalodisca vitripennis]|nr:hypothetical protein J6590_083126 [Homalodisca vitripennis]
MCQRDNRDQSSHQHQCLRQTPVSRVHSVELENEFAKWCRKRPNVFHFLAGKSVVQHQQSLKLDVELAACSPPS